MAVSDSVAPILNNNILVYPLRFSKQDFEGYLVPKFAPELARQRVIAREGGKGGGRGPRPLTPVQELCIALAFYASGTGFN